MFCNSSKIFSPHSQWIITGILGISLLLRWLLIFRGGQYYNSDETRYEVSLAAARLLWQGRVGEAIQQFTIAPEHLGFKVIGLIPALTEHLLGPSLILPTIFFSFFSVLNLYLIFLLSAATASRTEACLALAFAASSQSLLYYSRHLIPYDTSLFFGLFALYLSLAREHSVKTSFLCGTLSFLCFITYNGYWPLAAFAMTAHAVTKSKNAVNFLKKAVVTGISFVMPLALVILLLLQYGRDMISAYQLFATSITQGVFEEGWSLPFEYFWHTEHTIFLIWGALAALAILVSFKEQKTYTNLWAGGFLFIYFCLVVSSVVLEYFVVYARLARQMLPFLILLAASGFAQLKNRVSYARRITPLLLALVLVQAAWNFKDAFRVGFPRDFATDVQSRFPDFEFSPKRLAYGAPVICQDNGYLIANTKFYVAPPEKIPDVQGRLLLSAPHPTNYLPYLYEGDPPEFRKTYRTLRLQMKFYKADPEFMSETNSVWTTIESCVTAEE